MKRKPEREVIVRSATNGHILRIRRDRIVQLNSYGEVYRYATKAAVRAALDGASIKVVHCYNSIHVEQTYRFPNELRGQSLGCLVFRGANLAKLRKWAGVE